MKKRLISLTLIALIVALCFSLSACLAQSAYDIAVANGFIGTEQEWLNSLVGKNGKDGSDAAAVNIYDLFDAYKDLHPEATFEEFLYEFLSIDYYDTESAAAKAMLSVVNVRSRFQKVYGGFNPYYSGGAGVVYKISGDFAYIITNYHVVYDIDSVTTAKIADEILIYPYAATAYITAEYVGGSISKDIALIKVKKSDLPEFVQAAPVAPSGAVNPGVKVIAVGNPLAEGIAVTSGIVSVDSENIEMDALDGNGKSVMRVIRTDTPINSGNSGGGLFNTKGQLLGIINAKTVSSEIENVGYAIPVSIATGIADNVIENNSMKCILGVTVRVSATDVVYDSVNNHVVVTETITVDSVNTDAAVLGLLLVGDKLLTAKLNDTAEFALSRVFDLSDYLYKARVGDKLTLKVQRGEEVMTLDFTVSAASMQPV